MLICLLFLVESVGFSRGSFLHASTAALSFSSTFFLRRASASWLSLVPRVFSARAAEVSRCFLSDGKISCRVETTSNVGPKHCTATIKLATAHNIF